MGRRLTVVLLAILFLVPPLACPPAAALTTTVRVGYCRYVPPYQYEDDGGEAAGFHVDILNELAQDQGLIVEYRSFESTSEASDALKEGDIDAVLGIVTDQVLDPALQYSHTLSSANICLLAPLESAQLYRENRSRAFVLSSEYQILSYSYLSAITHRDVLVTSNQKESLLAQQRGQVDMVVGIKECLLWYLAEAGLTDRYEILINYVNSADFTIAVRTGDRYLLEEIDHGIRNVHTNGTYEKIYNKWFYVDDGSRYRRIVRILVLSAGALAAALAAYYLISRRTRRRLAEMVAERTRELNEANEELELKNREIREESELRQSIIESSPAAAFVFDQAFCLQFLNNAARALSPGAEVGQSILELPEIGEMIRKTGLDLFAQDWMSRADFLEMRNSIGGIEKLYRFSVHKINRSGDSPEALLSAEDITVEDREREALFEKRKNATLNQLIVGIAHEIKNPLTAINTSVEMIQKKGSDEKYMKAFSTYIPAEVERITRLINSLVGYARPAEGRNEPVNVTELIRSAYDLASVSAKGVKVSCEADPQDAIWVRGDRDRLKQSLMNVIFNGIESGQRKGAEDRAVHRVTIGCRREGEDARVEIFDDGVGMTAEEMQHCTEPFYTTKPTGTGIGLAVTKQYLDEIGGSMSLESEKGVYTRVIMRLPMMKEESKQ